MFQNRGKSTQLLPDQFHPAIQAWICWEPQSWFWSRDWASADLGTGVQARSLLDLPTLFKSAVKAQERVKKKKKERKE